LFPATGPTSVALGTLGQFGLLLLMFVTGGEMQLRPGERERRTVGMIAIAGLILPFVCGALFVQLLDYHHFSGPSSSLITFTLIFGIAVAVTCIPVISRIMLDLGLLHTPFVQQQALSAPQAKNHRFQTVAGRRGARYASSHSPSLFRSIFTVGHKLDLIRNFEALFFLCFFVLSCGLKASSIWFGAKLAGQPSGRAWDLAVGLNARGGLPERA